MKRTGSPKRGAAKAAKAAKQAAAAARLGVVTKLEIDDHPIIGRTFADDWRDLATTFRKISLAKHERFTLMDFARIALNAEARNYTEANETASATDYRRAKATLQLQRAAILFAYEALKNTAEPIIAECPDRAIALDLLQDLSDVLAELP